jgi:hypothetical protein
MMETSVGSTSVDPAKLASNAGGEQGLDLAAGKDLDLTKAAAKKDAWSAPESMLFQGLSDSAAGAPASGAPLGAASGGASGSLAQALKNVGKDSAGWGGEKAQRGFDAAHMTGGGLAGLGSVSGGGHSSASASPAGAFGVHNAAVSESEAHGLVDDGSAEEAAARGRSSMGGLSQMAGAANRAALEHSTDKAAGGLSKIFDGAKGQGSIAPGGSGAVAGAYESLDSAPVNLKVNPTDEDMKKITAPPPTPVPLTPSNGSQQMMEQLAVMAATMLIGGMVGGTAGQMMMMAGPMMMQAQAQQTAAQKAAADQANAQAAANKAMPGH